VDNLRLDGNALTAISGALSLASATGGAVALTATGDAPLELNITGTQSMYFKTQGANRFVVDSSGNLNGQTSGQQITLGADTGQKRDAAGVWRDTDAGGGFGWRQWAGESYLAANATNATATLANTGLSVTIKSGRKYAFKCILYVSDSTAAEGAQIDFGGGSATAANFRAHVTGFDTALTINTQVTTLTAAASAGTFTGAGMIEIHGALRPSSDGTFAPRFAQNTHAIGTLTLFEGSHLLMWDMP
jgi:hypothetical protein